MICEKRLRHEFTCLTSLIPSVKDPCAQAQLLYPGVPVTAINFLNFDSKTGFPRKFRKRKCHSRKIPLISLGADQAFRLLACHLQRPCHQWDPEKDQSAELRFPEKGWFNPVTKMNSLNFDSIKHECHCKKKTRLTSLLRSPAQALRRLRAPVGKAPLWNV